MLIVQARDRGLTFLSDDRNFAGYEVTDLALPVGSPATTLSPVRPAALNSAH